MKIRLALVTFGILAFAIQCLASPEAGPQAADEVLRQNPQIKTLPGIPAYLKGDNVQDCPSSGAVDLSRSRCVVAYVPGTNNVYVFALYPNSRRVWLALQMDRAYKSSVFLGAFDQNGVVAQLDLGSKKKPSTDNARSNSPALNEWHLSPHGLGAIALGSTIPDVIKATRLAFKTTDIEDSEAINYVLKNQPDALRLIVCPKGPLRGQIMQIRLFSKNFLIGDKGLRVGDSVDKFMQTYRNHAASDPLLKYISQDNYANYYRYIDPQDPKFYISLSLSRNDGVYDVAANFDDKRCEER